MLRPWRRPPATSAERAWRADVEYVGGHRTLLEVSSATSARRRARRTDGEFVSMRAADTEACWRRVLWPVLGGDDRPRPSRDAHGS